MEAASATPAGGGGGSFCTFSHSQNATSSSQPGQRLSSIQGYSFGQDMNKTSSRQRHQQNMYQMVLSATPPGTTAFRGVIHDDVTPVGTTATRTADNNDVVNNNDKDYVDDDYNSGNGGTSASLTKRRARVLHLVAEL